MKIGNKKTKKKRKKGRIKKYLSIFRKELFQSHESHSLESETNKRFV